MKPVDCHTHIYFEQFDEDREEVIERARKKLEFIVVPGTSYEENKEVLELRDQYPEFIKPNLGLHPTYTSSFDELEKIKQQIREEDPVAIGEIGLDHHHVTDPEERQRQEEVFREMLQLAEELDTPVVVHSREAEEKTIEILEEFSLPGVMLHCFNGKPELAEKAIREGMMIGVTTQVLYSSRVQEIASRIELENLLLETDAPYLYPDGRNEPVKVLESAEKIAKLRGNNLEKINEATTKNAIDLFS